MLSEGRSTQKDKGENRDGRLTRVERPGPVAQRYINGCFESSLRGRRSVSSVWRLDVTVAQFVARSLVSHTQHC